MKRSLTSASILSAIILLLGGCLVSSSNNEHVTGKYVADSTFDQIQAGKTTATWVQATLGDPSDKTKVEGDASEIWKYVYTEKKESSGAIFLIFGGTSNKEKTGIAFIEIKDGVVTNKWRG